MRYTFLVFLFLLRLSHIFSQNVITIESNDTLFMIGDKCLIHPSDDKNPQVQNVLNNLGFTENVSDHILLGGNNPDKVWIKFTLHNKTKENIFLESLYPAIDTATLYVVENGLLTQLQQTGQYLPFDSRSLDVNKLTFNLNPSDNPKIYLLSVKVKWPCNVELQVGTSRSIIRQYHRDDLLSGIFVGVILAFILYNCFIYTQLKESIYLIYSLYLACISGFLLRHQGYIFEFVTRNTPYLNDSTMILQAVAGLLGLFFIIKFLNIKKNLPQYYTYIQILYVFYGINILVTLLGFWELSIYMAYVSSPLAVILVAIIGYNIWLLGVPYAMYCMVGWVCLTLSTLVFILESRGLIPHTTFNVYCFHLGIALEAMFLSFAIAHRFGLINVENENNQARMIHTLEENKRLIDERNQMLEEKMQGHDSALQFALSKVNESEEKLQDYARQLEKSNRELTEFAHIASHDLKAPIRGILSFSQLFERRNQAKFDETDREYFNYIKSNAAQSARLIEDLLNYSKIDKNLGAPTPVELTNSVFMAGMNLQNVIQEKNAEVIYENLPVIKAHVSLMTHLFQNLIGNGIKYNKSKRPIIEIKAEKDATGEMVYSVKDNGIGIAPLHQKEVFAMFRRLHGQSEYEGTGIGLSFCTRIVETYGGRIWIESEAGMGTTFFFTLPKASVLQNEQKPVLA
jgi:signal transduction histidine kinase